MPAPRINLGKFIQDAANVLHGRINGLGIGSINVISEEATSLEGKPYLKLIADPMGEAYEVGAAFPREKDGLKYYSVNLESPLLPTPISAALFPDRGEANSFNLVWNRPEQPKPTAEAPKPAAEAAVDSAAVKKAEAPASETEKKTQQRRRPALGAML